MRRFIKIPLLIVLVIIILLVSKLFIDHQKGIARANIMWEKFEPVMIGHLTTTNTLSILPLIDWHTSDPGLKAEMGVSYLIKTDSTTLLFDVGHNAKKENPSPLVHNMDKLGIQLSDIDMVVISHNHFDHVGGKEFQKNRSFGLSMRQTEDLSGKKIITPVNMNYPNGNMERIQEPTVIAPAISTIGVIPRKLFIGYIEEQALAIQVKNKGIVLIVGCSHQTVPRIIARARQLFDMPIYGIIGGLHYPVPEGRLEILGLNAQRIFSSGKGPFNPLTWEDMITEMEMLKELNPGVIGVGGHDSSDEAIDLFKNNFPNAYREVKVGKWIRI